MAAGDSVPEACSDPLLSVLHGQGRAGLRSGSSAQWTFGVCFQGSLEQKSPPLCCSVASAAPEFVGSSSIQIFYGLCVRS